MFSQPSDTISTPPAFGWFARAASIFLVFSWSSPSWLQPNGWVYANTPSHPSPIMSCPIFLSIFAVLFTQPTVGIIQISFLVAALPSCRKYPLKVTSHFFGWYSFSPQYVYSIISLKFVFKLCSCICSPFLQSIVKWPIGLPYLIIFSPFFKSFKSTLCPKGISSKSLILSIISPFFSSLSATATLSLSFILNNLLI